ncbi:MAG: threonine--tRNA ligase [bacterium]|nr:threonine--tRNA ligase [bacterium]
MTLETLRHSTAHVLAQAVTELYPDTILGTGPSISTGFYYDFDIKHKLTQSDLNRIENRMQEIVKRKTQFEYSVLDKQEALSLMREKNQIYKIELIEDLGAADFSFYKCGSFIDLCKGPHIKDSGEIPAFKLLSVAGAYWKGSEENKMLQRIYGTAFFNKKDLRSYLNRLEEAKKRDHRVLGRELDLFSMTEETGAGLVLWHPRGACIRDIIEGYWKKEHYKAGYELFYSPHIGLADLWKTSGHLDFYNDNMYSPVNIENHDFYIKPMNCPFHIVYYKNTNRSYRELPVRLAELGTVYRYERSGTLHGLLRVRGFTQDDAHIICTPDQVHDEILQTLKFSIDMLNVFGFDKFNIFLSTKPAEKYVGKQDQWEKAQDALKTAIETLNLPFQLDEGGGAFYGPKIDIKIEDAIGREWQCSTIQFDFNLPERFNMSYVGSDGNKKRPYMIHRALLGAIERFFGILIEHYAGKFPLWLASTQVKVLNISEHNLDYSREIVEKLKKEDIRADIDDSSEKIGYKIRLGIKQKVPYLIVTGRNEQDNNTVSVRSRDEGDLGEMTLDKFISIIKNNTVNKV